MAQNDIKARLLADFKAKIAEVNRVIGKGTNAELEARLNELNNIEKEYRGVLEKEVFASLLDTRAAIEKHHFETIAHKKISNEGQLTGIEETTKNVQIDLAKFCEYKGFDRAWFYEMQALNKRLTLKVALAIGVPKTEIKKINDSYYMDKLAEQIELGKTPDSATQCVKHIQKVLDMVCPDAGKVNGYDLAYIMGGYTKRSNKEALKLICSKHTVLQSLLMDVFHNVVTGKGYGLEYKRKPAKQQVEEKVDKAAENGAKGSGKKGNATPKTGKKGSGKKKTETVAVENPAA